MLQQATFKIMMVGDQSVGKTHIFHQFVSGKIPHSVQATIGMDFYTKNIRAVRTGDLVKLNIFDTAGEEKFHAVTACHYRKAKGAVIVYDVTNRESFENLDRWLNDVKELADSDCVIMVLGNKCDIDQQVAERTEEQVASDRGALSSERQRQVSTEEGIEFAKQHEVSFFEVSAIDNTNIKEAFDILTQQIVDQFKVEQSDYLGSHTDRSNP